MTGTDGLEGAAGAVETGLAADAVGSGRLPRRKSGHGELCANCGAPLDGPFCHECGQHDADMRKPFWSLLAEIIEGLFSLDGRVLRTLPALMLRPGRMTARYLAGERARYVQPFRLYLIASVLFFVSLAFLGTGGVVAPSIDLQSEQAQAEMEEAAIELAQARERAEEEGRIGEAEGLASVEAYLESARGKAEQVQEDVDAAAGDAVASGMNMNRARWKLDIHAGLIPEDFTEEQLQQISADGERTDLSALQGLTLEQRRWMYERAERIIDDPSLLWEAMQRWAPRLMFVLLPIYALTLAVMHFWRRDFVFYDHLIVSLHAHAFFFFMMTGLILISLAGAAAWAPLIFILWSNFYVYRLHRRVYRHGRISSALRTLTLDLFYLVVLSFALIVLLFVGVAFV